MEVKRVVANIAVDRTEDARRFYCDVLGLEIAMDLGWYMTLSSGADAPVQIGFATEGGSGTEVPDLSIEVDDVDMAYRRMRDAGFEFVYSLTDEPWGVRRFYTRDPCGKLVNILSHR